MSLINIEAKTNEVKEKVKPRYGTTGDLAKAVIDSWSEKNSCLLQKADKALGFVCDDLSSKQKSFFSRLFYTKANAKHQRIFYEVAMELQFLVNEIEYLIGFDTYMKAGVKHKFKNKKLFDDKLSEYREITVMINGILNDLCRGLLAVDSFKHEREILISLAHDKDENDSSYYRKLYLFLTTLRFE